MKRPASVRVWTEDVTIPTYLPAPPDKNPMFLEKRVYQGSSGKVYPLPFTDRIAEEKTPRKWKAVWLENEFLRLMILPELGGRIHVAQDKTNGYDFIYRQSVIKPALVGLAGPWISGGIEFNWPQHHRPATFLPVAVEIETHGDGARTVWLSDHDPLCRMKGMHGVCLHPGKACLELKVRLYNRTPMAQTFLWWANVAVHVHEAYQSFFPPDAHYVADHAKRATSQYPLCQGLYYGVDYGVRGRRGVPPEESPSQFVPPHCGGKAPVNYRPNDLAWYANIPTPCSYMCVESQGDFFGGYDHAKQAGIIHVASHHISPGKKQWTWGNHDFGYAWDRNLTDADGPYIELMAGVYTDNQPDFSFLQPGETKAWSQHWYPIQAIGPAHQANVRAAVSLHLERKRFRLGVCVTEPFPRAIIRLVRPNGAAEWVADLAPGRPFSLASPQARRPWKIGETTLRVLDRQGREIIAFTPQPREKKELPPPATEPPMPEHIATADELYLTGLHLEQYRHATRGPTLYWREALRRDPGDARCNNALGLWHLRRGEFAPAESHFRRAIVRLTARNPNPYCGEAYYNLGLCLRYQLNACLPPVGPLQIKLEEAAYAAFAKAAWNLAWQSPSYHALAELNCRRSDWSAALDHLDRSLQLNPENLLARDLRAMVLRRLERAADAHRELLETLALDPLDWWARWLRGEPLRCDWQIRLDVAHDLARAGLYSDAIALLEQGTPLEPVRLEGAALPDQNLGVAPLVHYTLGWLYEKVGDLLSADTQFRRGAQLPPDYCFPARLEEIAVFQTAARHQMADGRAAYYLGNLFYDRCRHVEAIGLWERSVVLDGSNSIAWRNLGIGYYNIRQQPSKARRAYDRALAANPSDARLLYERDQLWKRLGEPPTRRLRELEKHADLVRRRDDLSLESCALYKQTRQPLKALQILQTRHFQPWEGGEGLVLGQFIRTQLALGRQALARSEPSVARGHFASILAPPRNLGEAWHLLGDQSEVRYWLGLAYDRLGNRGAAQEQWRRAAKARRGLQEMRVRLFSEWTLYSALALKRLGRRREARTLLRELLAYARQLYLAPARLEYFATSLPARLLFEDDLQARQQTLALFLQAQAQLGLGQTTKAKRLLRRVLNRDPNHPLAGDLGGSIQLRTDWTD